VVGVGDVVGVAVMGDGDGAGVVGVGDAVAVEVGTGVPDAVDTLDDPTTNRVLGPVTHVMPSRE
jgi:hypothetical protein